MKELVIISGKGGTGKTSLTGAFASLSTNTVLCDADVDAADLHLLLDPQIERQTDFYSGHKAVIDPDRCTRCGLCREACRFGAVSADFRVDPFSCEGCGVCVALCPERAVSFPENLCGRWFISATRFGPLVHARLGAGEENSGKLVALVRREARNLAEEKHMALILTDGPPGVGCPVIASIGGADAVLIVTEPSLSGLHDLERVLQLATHFRVPAMICINKFDLNMELSRKIEAFAAENSARIAGLVPFDPAVTRTMVKGRTLLEDHVASEAGREVTALWRQVRRWMAL
jgi:MinD superfamily P-loop ATPase